MLIIKKLNIQDLNYYFYNVPFCLFKKLWENFINEYCLRNRLCNYYKGYVDYWKCYKCNYWLFCNNFNSNIGEKSLESLDWFYDDTSTLSREDFLNKLLYIKHFLCSLWYSENDICFYTTQKYMASLIIWERSNILKSNLKYLSVYIFIKDNKLTRTLFEGLNTSILLFKKQEHSETFNNIIQNVWFSINMGVENFLAQIVEIPYEWETIRFDTYFSYFKTIFPRPFFDFSKGDLLKNNGKTSYFRWKIFNPSSLIYETKFCSIKNAWEAMKNNLDIYIWRDILLWNWINKYKWILLTSDNLWKKWRFLSSMKSVNIPVIYDIKPNISNILNDGDIISIDFSNWLIKKC